MARVEAVPTRTAALVARETESLFLPLLQEAHGCSEGVEIKSEGVRVTSNVWAKNAEEKTLRTA
jgi:hypothetical protein